MPSVIRPKGRVAHDEQPAADGDGVADGFHFFRYQTDRTIFPLSLKIAPLNRIITPARTPFMARMPALLFDKPHMTPSSWEVFQPSPFGLFSPSVLSAVAKSIQNLSSVCLDIGCEREVVAYPLGLKSLISSIIENNAIDPALLMAKLVGLPLVVRHVNVT